MDAVTAAIALPGAIIWTAILLVPWRPWGTREHLEPHRDGAVDLSDLTVLIPARDEGGVIGRTLAGLREQGTGLQVVVIDDQSSDATATLARVAGADVIDGQPLPPQWAGKLWALEQGRRQVTTRTVLLLDADIEMLPGMLSSLISHKRAGGYHFVSLMADLQRTSVWDCLLLPCFVYFFKLLYPFRLSNSQNVPFVAAAAGGCVLMDTAVLDRIGAFGSLRSALIDDCTLARQVKRVGFKTWIGLSRGVVSLRRYRTLGSVHDMVARSAFTQLGYSSFLLLLVTAVMLAAFAAPLAACLQQDARPYGLFAWGAMALTYWPTMRYYSMSPAWGLALPLSGMLYLGMTWSSALRYWRGTRSIWKGRAYSRP